MTVLSVFVLVLMLQRARLFFAIMRNTCMYTRVIACMLKLISVVKAPYLRQPLLALYQDKASYLKSPEKVSHYMLYGNNADGATARKEMPFMIPVYNLLEKYVGKVIYVNFWGVIFHCPLLCGHLSGNEHRLKLNIR